MELNEQNEPIEKKAKRVRVDTDFFRVCDGEHVLLKSFLIALIVATVMFLPSILWDEGYFLFLGDFNSQQVPFYLLCHRAVRAGAWGFNWMTDLGVNFIGSYSFYVIGSPFFWLTVPFSETVVPYLMGPLLILKYATMSFMATAWLRRYTKKPEYAILGGLLYGFCGYTMYNTFFNHFLDVMVFFPLMLIGMDELVENNKRGLFALSVALCAFVNYVFFAGEAVFMILYYLIKVWKGAYQTSIARFFAIGFEAILGFLMASVFLFPSLIVMLDNPRSSGMLNGYNFWIYSSARKYWVILLNFFFPPELPSQPILVTDSYMRWTSVQAYIPIFGMAGVICFLRMKRNHWLKSLIVLLIIMAFIPGLNSMFTVMNSSYYARWYFMLSLMLILATVVSLEQAEERDLADGFKISAAFTLIAILALAITPTVTSDSVRIGIYRDGPDGLYPFIAMSVTCVISVIVLYRLFKLRGKYPRLFINYCLIAVALFGMLFGNYYLIYGKTRSFDTKGYIIPDAICGQEKVEMLLAEEKEQFFRIDTDDSFINIGMFWNVPSIHAFHSIVPSSIIDYYEFIGDERSVSSKMSAKNYASRALLSVKYFADRADYTSDVFGDIHDASVETAMPGFVYTNTQAGYDLWLNKNALPMGFTFDSYITFSEAEQFNTSNRDKLMMKTLILPDDVAGDYDGVLKHASATDFAFTQKEFLNDVENRRNETATRFQCDSYGFSADITLQNDNLVFFSVPYENGAWTAMVNGKAVKVEKAQIGFMAIPCEAGENHIEVHYEVPGLRTGMIVSIGGVAIWIGYVIWIALWKRKKNNDAKALECVEKPVP